MNENTVADRIGEVLLEFAAQAYAYEEGTGPRDVGSQIPDDLERAVQAILDATEVRDKQLRETVRFVAYANWTPRGIREQLRRALSPEEEK